ncbi:FecR family protein [Pedobacter sp. JY14-1]|uniref:FecR family protein n=1 Tax=Pedobacter sp. JY14-1 TaxID=3034151 RepID=UPI0023E304E4|nr:FecR family protein [Pedobacter sp. JY14-1]
MNQNQLKALYAKLVSRKISDQELDALLDYFEAGESGEPEAMIAQELEYGELPEIYQPSEVSAGQRVFAKLKAEIFSEKTESPQKARLWPVIYGAAAIAMVVFGAGLFYFKQNGKEITESASIVSHDVAPGKPGATLTLSNGKQIRLGGAANGQLAIQAGVKVSKLANGQLVYELRPSADTRTDLQAVNMLSTLKGETYQLRLPDGSQVWLNAASSLTYAANLIEGGVRSVKLSGEAYFEITKDKHHPFVVESPGQQVKVLGTRFNISSYPDEPSIKTTLLEGSVQLNGQTVLKPGEQATILAAGKMSVSHVDVDEAVAWKNGKFMFLDENIEDIMRKLARWYNVEVTYEGTPPTKTFTASISRFDHISKILDKLSYTNNVHFKMEGRRVTVMK